ncbi:MAG: glycosyltransferase [Candidatus Wallbacteria bacterium]
MSENIKISIFNSKDIEGGAAVSAFRLYQGLKKIGGIDASYIVNNKKTDFNDVISAETKFQKLFCNLVGVIDKIPLMLYYNRQKSTWSNNYFPNIFLSSYLDRASYDIANVHWIGGGFFPVYMLNKIGKPLVFTLHDSWIFTGGCHLPLNCDNFIKGCGKCPQLNSNSKYDLSRLNLNKKHEVLSKIKRKIFVCPSNWLSKIASKSSVLKDFDIRVIPNGIDINSFRQIEKEVARKILGIDLNKKIILSGAKNFISDKIKGYSLFINSINLFLDKINDSQNYEIILFGASKPVNNVELRLKTNYISYLYDEVSLRLLYSAADIMVVPSITENLPNTIMESLACGTPVVAFNIGGISDLVDHKINGYLASPFDENDLVNGMLWILSSDEKHYLNISNNCKTKIIKGFSLNDQSYSYLSLFKELLK